MVDRGVADADAPAELAQPERFALVDQRGGGGEHRLAEVAVVVGGAAARHLSIVTRTYQFHADLRW